MITYLYHPSPIRNCRSSSLLRSCFSFTIRALTSLIPASGVSSTTDFHAPGSAGSMVERTSLWYLIPQSNRQLRSSPQRQTGAKRPIANFGSADVNRVINLAYRSLCTAAFCPVRAPFLEFVAPGSALLSCWKIKTCSEMATGCVADTPARICSTCLCRVEGIWEWRRSSYISSIVVDVLC